MFSLWLFKNYQYLWVSESKFKVPNKLIFLWSWSPDLKKLNCKWDVFMLVCKVVSLALTMMKYQLSYLVYHIMPYTMKPLVLTSLYSMVSLYHTSRSCWQSCHIIWSSLYNLYISMWWEIQHSFQRWSCYAVLFKAPEQFKIVAHGQKALSSWKARFALNNILHAVFCHGPIKTTLWRVKAFSSHAAWCCFYTKLAYKSFSKYLKPCLHCPVCFWMAGSFQPQRSHIAKLFCNRWTSSVSHQVLSGMVLTGLSPWHHHLLQDFSADPATFCKYCVLQPAPYALPLSWYEWCPVCGWFLQLSDMLIAVFHSIWRHWSAGEKSMCSYLTRLVTKGNCTFKNNCLGFSISHLYSNLLKKNGSCWALLRLRILCKNS